MTESKGEPQDEPTHLINDQEPLKRDKSRKRLRELGNQLQNIAKKKRNSKQLNKDIDKKNNGLKKVRVNK